MRPAIAAAVALFGCSALAPSAWAWRGDYQVLRSGRAAGAESFTLENQGGRLRLTGRLRLDGPGGVSVTSYKAALLPPFGRPDACRLQDEAPGRPPRALRWRFARPLAGRRAVTATGSVSAPAEVGQDTWLLAPASAGFWTVLLQAYDGTRRGRQPFATLDPRDGLLRAVTLDYRGEEVLPGAPGQPVARTWRAEVGEGVVELWTDGTGRVVRLRSEGAESYLEGWREAFGGPAGGAGVASLSSVSVSFTTTTHAYSGTLLRRSELGAAPRGLVLVTDPLAPAAPGLAEALAELGGAALTYRWPPAGGAGFEEAVAAAAAAVAWLARRPEAGGEPPLLAGHGLGGLVAASAAARCRDQVAGLVLVGCLGRSVEAAAARRLAEDLDRDRMDAAYRRRAGDDLRRYVAALDRGIAPAAGEPAPAVPLAVAAAAAGGAVAGLLGREPAGALREVEAPILILQGGADALASPDDPALLERAANDGAARDVVVRVLPGLEHGLRAARGGDGAGGVAPAARTALRDWLQSRGFTAPQ